MLGAKVNASRFHDTALHHAARRDSVELLDMLVQFGANVYARDKHNHLASHFTKPGTAAQGCLLHYESEYTHTHTNTYSCTDVISHTQRSCIHHSA